MNVSRVPVKMLFSLLAGFLLQQTGCFFDVCVEAGETKTSDSDLFTTRILPLAKSPNASSCTECHLSGVELKQYIQKDEASTFASLRAAGLIDTKKPEDSKLLQFIARRPGKPNELTERVRTLELAAFSEWIMQAVNRPELLKATADEASGLDVPVEVIRHARKDRVVSAFVDSIWSEMGRCQNCHSPQFNRNKIGKQHTEEEVDAISWIVPHDPAATLQKLVDSGNIDLDSPGDSAVLTKPAGLTKHGGGPKFFPGSDTYRKFADFLTDYAAIRSGRYLEGTKLPAAPKEIVLLTGQQLRITKIPHRFAGKSLQVDLFAWDEAGGSWSTHRCATGFSKVNPKEGLWQNHIQLVLSPEDPELSRKRDTPLLPPGRYKVALLVDQHNKAEKDPHYALTQADGIGQIEVSGDWPPGYQPPKIAEFAVQD